MAMRGINKKFSWLWVLGAVWAGIGCSDTTVPADAPEGHTVMKDGAAHKPGLNDPQTNCVACHGATLEGGADGEPSCFTCHGKKW